MSVHGCFDCGSPPHPDPISGGGTIPCYEVPDETVWTSTGTGSVGL